MYCFYKIDLNVMKKIYICLVFILLCMSAFCENDVVVVDLVPNRDRSTSTNTVKQNSKKKSATSRSSAVKEYTHKSGEKIKLGNYAMFIADIGYIYSKPSQNSNILGVISYQDVVIVKKQSGDFYGIMLEDGVSVGWIYAGQLKRYDVEVWAKSVKTDLPDNGVRGYDKNKIPQSSIVLLSMNYRKTPYVYGGTSITKGMDCSAFVKDVFQKLYSINLPRTARQQATVGVDVPISQATMKEGDRLYFRYKNSYIDHTGIYLGNGYYIHCNSGKHGVSIDYLWSKRTSSKLVAVKRMG